MSESSSSSKSPKSTDEQVLELQLGRPLITDCNVVHRCELGLPVVSMAAPIDRRGLPFPTRYWLSCPLANIRVGRIEADGGVIKLERRRAEPKFQQKLDAAHSSYAAARDELVDKSAAYLPTGGVGGAREGIKCLHAHLAHHLGGGSNEIGEEVATQVGNLCCATPCILSDDEGIRKNPNWHREKI